MTETVNPAMPDQQSINSATWLTEAELAVYAGEFSRTGFQGGLNWYSCVTSGRFSEELKKHGGKTIDIPSMFIAGAGDWGIYQKPGEFEAMQHTACTNFTGRYLLNGAGHWVQQEQPETVTGTLLQFLKNNQQNKAVFTTYTADQRLSILSSLVR